MIKLIIALIVGFTFLPLAAATPALAAGANDQIFSACAGHADSAVCQDEATQNQKNTNPINNYIHVAADIVAALAGVAAIIMIIVSGFKFVTGGSNQQSVVEARNTLLWAVIGLATTVLAWTILTFAIDKLIT